MCKLVFMYSQMNSGKQLQILTKAHTLENKGFQVQLMKPDVDDRTSKITSRLGIEKDCIIVDKSNNPQDYILKSKSKKPDFILVDEAQFLSKEQVWDLAGLVDNWGVNVYCYGLKLDWQGNFFTGSEQLMKIADELLPIENFCKENKGALAFFHIKKGGSDDPVETGYEDLYDTVSRKVWKQWWDSKT